MMFTSEEVMDQHHWQITSRVTKIVIQGDEGIISFLTSYHIL